VASYRRPFWITAGQKVASISAIFSLPPFAPGRRRATAEQKRICWKMTVTIERIVCTALHEVDDQYVEETMVTLSKEPEGFYEQAAFILPQLPP